MLGSPEDSFVLGRVNRFIRCNFRQKKKTQRKTQKKAIICQLAQEGWCFPKSLNVLRVRSQINSMEKNPLLMRFFFLPFNLSVPPVQCCFRALSKYNTISVPRRLSTFWQHGRRRMKMCIFVKCQRLKGVWVYTHTHREAPAVPTERGSFVAAWANTEKGYEHGASRQLRQLTEPHSDRGRKLYLFVLIRLEPQWWQSNQWRYLHLLNGMKGWQKFDHAINCAKKTGFRRSHLL